MQLRWLHIIGYINVPYVRVTVQLYVVVTFKSVKNRLFCQKKILNLKYGTHKLQPIIFWGCIQGMNQQTFLTIHLNISIGVLNEPLLRQRITKIICL